MDDMISRAEAIEAVYYNPYSTAVGTIKKSTSRGRYTGGVAETSAARVCR